MLGKVPMRSLRIRRHTIRRCDRRGAAVVEFAVVAPLFFLLLAGIIEFGQAFRIEHALSNASRRGARAAIFEYTTNSQAKQLVRAHVAKTVGVNEGDVTVDIAVNGSSDGSLSGAEQGDEISVTVSIPFSKAGVGFYANMFSNSTLSSTSILEHE
jgi:Flp pilus assembly protein TadG